MRAVRRALAIAALLLGLSPALADDAAARRATDMAARLLDKGDADGAVRELEDAHRAVPESRNAARNLALALSRRAEAALRRKDGATALDALDRALELHPGRLYYQVLRGRALHLLGRPGDAQRAAEVVVEKSPTYAEGWLLLVEVHERAGELDEALAALDKIAALRPDDEGLRRRRATLATRAESEARYLTHGTGNFRVRYSPDIDPGTVRLALTLLEDAYSNVTADLGVAPRTPAQVVLYEGAEFQRITGAHSWVGALYHNGTLRVPIRNLERHQATAARVLAHEFTHHVLKERNPGLPIWWHEGIAQFIEDRDATQSRRRRARLDKQLAPLVEKDALLGVGQLRRLKITSVRDPVLVNLFYAQALSFVGWLVDGVGPGALPAFLVALGTGTDTDEAARRAFGSDVEELLRKWREAL